MKNKRVIVIAAICIVFIVGVFFVFTNRKQKNPNDVELTTVQQIITKDLENNYPKTPREVVKTYNEIISCFYNEECSNDEIVKLCEMVLALLDEELLANNPKELYVKNVKAEITDHKAKGKTIVSYKLESSNDVEYRTVDERECAYIDCSYFLKDKSGYSKSYMTYVVRKDENDNWKVLVYYMSEGDTSDGEE